MKDSKFIELLNLYVDQEISPEESLLLEREITNNPERRKVYLQYCRMHRASVLLCESFRSEQAPSGSKLAKAARSADDKIARYPERKAAPFAWGWFGAGGVAVAAACAVFMFTRSGPSGAHETGTLASQLPQANSNVASVALEHPTPTPTLQPVKPLLVARSLDEGFHAQTAGFQGTSTASTLDWMNKVKLPPMKGLSLDEQPFDAKNALEQVPVSFRNQEPIQGRVEMTAFQFQR